MSRVLSIQSHVVHGYVGNKAAVFPLQLLGFDVDIINSVNYSCHTGYPSGWEGDILNGNQLRLILDGLNRNKLIDGVGHLLTGYIGSETFLRAVLDVLQTLKQKNASIRYVCDPVFGDDGKLYVPEELVDIYRKEVIPHANVITPNQFEAEQLLGISINTFDDGKLACKALHDIGPGLVVITSMMVQDQIDSIFVLASQRILDDNGIREDVWCIESPIVEGQYTGTGDLCAALLLAWTARESKLKRAMEKVISTMYSVINMTRQNSDGSIKSKELRLIQSKTIIEDPPKIFNAIRL